MNFIKRNKIVIITVLSIIYIIIYKFILSDMPEVFKKAYELGDLVYNISLAVLTSSIFYYFVNYLKDQETKNKLAMTVNNRMGHLSMMKSIIYQDILQQTSYKNPPQNISTVEEFTKICSGIKLNSKPAPYWNGQMLQFSTWFEYFEYTFSLDKYNIDILYKYSNVINEETLNRFDEVKHTTFHSGIRQYKNSSAPYANELVSLAGPLYCYLDTLGQFQDNKWK